MTSIKTILISHIPLPYTKIGSWSTLYNNLITSPSSPIDIIICPTLNSKYNNLEYGVYNPKINFFNKIAIKLNFKTKWDAIFESLKKVTNKQDKYILQIIDNTNIIIPLNEFLIKEGIRDNFYIQYFYHGFQPVISNLKGEIFFKSFNELIFLTHKSYHTFKEFYNSFPVKCSVLHNGIDTEKFFRLEPLQKQFLKQEFKIEDKKIFLWCSQDRPKKGLHIILDAWKQIETKHKNIELWIIGTQKKQNTDTVKYFGKISNNDLPKYFQVADAYLFSTLCQEGFGLSLIEAMHCGCYCIASDVGGVSEVLQNGAYGRLISNPNFVSDWIEAITNVVKNPMEQATIPKNLYSTISWNENMNVIIKQAKECF